MGSKKKGRSSGLDVTELSSRMKSFEEDIRESMDVAMVLTVRSTLNT